jgi:hypothetical protein
MTTIRSAWENYEIAMLPEEATPILRREIRRAFYSGAHVALGLVMALGKDGVSDEAAQAGLQAMHNDLCMFFVDVMARQA